MTITQLPHDNHFFKELSNSLKMPDEKDKVHQILCAVLHAIHHHLTVEEFTYFKDKLPVFLKELYNDALETDKNKTSLHSKDAFFEEVYQLSGGKTWGVFESEEQVAIYVETVIDWLRALVGIDALPLLPIRLRIYVDTYMFEGQSLIY